MNKLDIKSIGDKFVVTRNNVPVNSGLSNKITEFASIEDAQKYMNILKMLDKQKQKTAKI